jgi:amino-acid N-acetyltransferase
MATEDIGTGSTRSSLEQNFSEKSFYLNEFRGRTLAIAVGAAELSEPAPLEAVLKDLEQNGTRVVLISDRATALRSLTGGEPIPADGERLEGLVWRELRASPRVGVLAPEDEAFPVACREIGLILGVSKLLWVDSGGPVVREDGRRHSFVDLEDLRGLLRHGLEGASVERRALLVEIELALSAGLPAINLCTLEGFAQELFSYEGSGTLFTRERYVATRSLSIDDFDAAYDLVTRGVAEAFLAPRSEEETLRILGSGFGAFVEGRYLAGIGALLPWDSEAGAAPVGEIACLYTLTRFVGEGVGGHLVNFAVERARGQGCSEIFACTTSERVVSFFERHHFKRVGPEALPAEKWRGYDPARREVVQCLTRDLSLSG